MAMRRQRRRAANPGRRRWPLTALTLAVAIAAASAFAPRPLRDGPSRAGGVPMALRSSPDATANDPANGDAAGGSGGKRSRRKPRLPSKNLYEILGADPSMSRGEIKRLYISLAKETHPDSSNNSDEVDRFNEIAQAWEVISDSRSRRAYDRELAAQDFKEDVAKRAGDLANEYGPAARKFYEDFAIPLIKRTTATTIASWNAVNEVTSETEAEMNVGKNNAANSRYKVSGATLSDVVREQTKAQKANAGAGDALEDFGRAFQRVIEAGVNATRRIDGMELQEKSVELRQRADDTRAESMEVFERLKEIKAERLRLTFHTSSAEFTSTDAVQFLEGFARGNDTDKVTLMQRVTGKHPISKDIEAFADAESEFDQKLLEKSSMDQMMQDQQRALERAERDAHSAVQAEERARKMLEEAQRQVTESQRLVVDTQKSIRDIETEAKKVDQELTKADTVLKRKRDMVRRELKRKADKVEGSMFDEEGNGKVRLNPGFDKSSMNSMGFEERNLAAIDALREDERQIEGEFLKLVEKASRLVSRSERLRLRSEELIGEQMAEDQATKEVNRGTVIGD